MESVEDISAEQWSRIDIPIGAPSIDDAIVEHCYKLLMEFVLRTGQLSQENGAVGS